MRRSICDNTSRVVSSGEIWSADIENDDAMNIFRFDEPVSEDLEAFHRDGYLAYPDVFTDEAREGLIEEIHQFEPVREFLGLSDEERDKLEYPAEFPCGRGTNADPGGMHLSMRRSSPPSSTRRSLPTITSATRH